MASTFTTNLRIEKPADGEKDTTWGQVINDNITSMFEEAISAEAPISTTGGTTTLTTANGTTDEARKVFLDVSGTLVSNSTIAIPDLNKFYLIRNGTAGAYTVTIKPTGTGVAVVQGETMIVYCDGTNCFEIGMGGFTVTALAKTLLDDTTAAAVMTTLGITTYMQTLLDDANEATFKATANLEVGTDTQAWDAQLDDIAALAVTNSNFIVGDGTNWVAETGATALASLGATIGTNVQAWDAQLDDIAALAVTDSNFIVGDGTNWVAETGATARISLGLKTGCVLQTFFGVIAAATGTAQIAADDTTPLVSEGTEIWTQAITPAASGNDIEINMAATVATSTDGGSATITLYRGSTCIGAVIAQVAGTTSGAAVTLNVVDSPSTTSSTTYSARVGGWGSTWYINQVPVGARYNGMLAKTGYTVKEISA